MSGAAFAAHENGHVRIGQAAGASSGESGMAHEILNALGDEFGLVFGRGEVERHDVAFFVLQMAARTEGLGQAMGVELSDVLGHVDDGRKLVFDRGQLG